MSTAAATASLDRQRIDTLFRNSPIYAVVNNLVWLAAAIPFIGTIPNAWLTGWAVWCMARFALRSASIAWYRRARDRHSPAFWAVVYGTLSALAGLSWGLAATYAYSVADPLQAGLVCALLAAMSMGGVTNGIHMPIFLAFVAPSLVPFALYHLWLGGSLDSVIGFVTLAYFLAATLTARLIGRSILSVWALRETNAALIDELRAAKTEAEAASRAKSEFLAAMSHELRTPLNAILGFSDMMRSLPLTPAKTAEYAGDIHGAGSHLLAVIGDILDLAKIEAGRFEMVDQQLDLEELGTSCMAMVEGAAANGGIKLAQSFDPSVRQVRADERALRQVLLNLLSNAVKFTPPGGAVELQVAPARDGAVAVIVTDTGVGIAPDALERIFRPFEQADAGVARRFGGTGLGLAISRELMRRHEGDLRLESELGRGTRAIATLPKTRRAAAA